MRLRRSLPAKTAAPRPGVRLSLTTIQIRTVPRPGGRCQHLKTSEGRDEELLTRKTGANGFVKATFFSLSFSDFLRSLLFFPAVKLGFRTEESSTWSR